MLFLLIFCLITFLFSLNTKSDNLLWVSLYCCVMSLITMYLCKNDYLEFFSKGNKENKNQETEEDEVPKENKKKKTKGKETKIPKGHETPKENKPVKENKKPKEPKIPNTVNVTKKTLDDFKNFLYMYNMLIDFKTNNVNVNVTTTSKDIIKSIDKNMKTMKDVYDVYDKYLKDSSNSLIKTNLNKVHSTLYKTKNRMKSIIEKINKFKMSNAQLIITKPPPSPPTVVPFVSTLTAPTPAPSSLVGATAVSSDSVSPLPVTVVPPVTVPTQAPSSLIGVTAVSTDTLSPLSLTVVPPSSDVTVAPINVMAPVTVVPPESLGPIVTSVTVPTQAPSSLIRLTSSTDSLSSPLPPTEPSTVTVFPTSLSPSSV